MNRLLIVIAFVAFSAAFAFAMHAYLGHLDRQQAERYENQKAIVQVKIGKGHKVMIDGESHSGAVFMSANFAHQVSVDGGTPFTYTPNAFVQNELP